MLPMATGLPQLGVVHVRRDHLGEASAPVFVTHQGHQLIVDVGASGQEEAAARRQLMEEEEFLIHSDLAMVALRSLFLQWHGKQITVRSSQKIVSIERIKPMGSQDHSLEQTLT